MLKNPIIAFISLPALRSSSAPNAALMLGTDVVAAARSRCDSMPRGLHHSGSQEGDPTRHKARTTAAEPLKLLPGESF
jgi:hypothetical protein